jgi:hypothetical protein
MKILEICLTLVLNACIKASCYVVPNNAKLLGIFFSHLICKNFKISKKKFQNEQMKKQINIGQENIGMGKVLHVHIELFLFIHDN